MKIKYSFQTAKMDLYLYFHIKFSDANKFIQVLNMVHFSSKYAQFKLASKVSKRYLKKQ